MIISLETTPEFHQRVKELSRAGKDILAALTRGLKDGVEDAAANVQENYLTGQSLKSRTGTLRRSVTGWLQDESTGAVGVAENAGASKYAWLLTDEQKTIRPKSGKFLTIPIGENLTGSGVPRWTSPRQRPDGFFVKSKAGKLLYGYKNGKKGKFRPLFVLVTQVTVKGSGALYDGVFDSLDDITGSMQKEIDEVLN